MKTFILIIIIWYTPDGGPATATAEFNSEATCKSAIIAMQQAWGAKTYSVCVEK